MHDIFDVLPDDILKTLIEETDEFAIKNVQSGKGGPFGASVHVYDLVSGDLTMIGDLEANAVIDKGMGSAHAEDQAMNPETVNALKSYLESLSKHSDAVVIFSSSGESCPACHSKEEILNRHLIDEGLLKSGRFAVTYGATYADTANIAGFNDEPYHRDMQKPKGSGMISIDRDNIINIPDEVRQIFEQSDVPVSVIALPDGRFIAGYEDRDADLMATSEVSAIRAATQKLRADGIVESWVLGGASLYTSTSDVGPLGYAECQWADVTQWIAVDHSMAKKWATQEAQGISNDAFFSVIAAPSYNGHGASIAVKRIEPFDNKAQHEWKNKSDRIMYNGIELD